MSNPPICFSESEASEPDILSHNPTKYAGIYFSKLVYLLAGLVQIPVAITRSQINDEIASILRETTVISISIWRKALVFSHETKAGAKRTKVAYQIDPKTLLANLNAIAGPIKDYAQKWEINLSMMTSTIPEKFVPACSVGQLKSTAANVKDRMVTDNISLTTAVERMPKINVKKAAVTTTNLILVFEDGSSFHEKIPKKYSISDAEALIDHERFSGAETVKMILATEKLHYAWAQKAWVV